MRAIWKGFLRFGLVTIPVKMYPASRSHTLRFNQLHGQCGNRIILKRFCPKCNRELRTDEIVKGYEYGKDTYIIVSDEEFEKAKRQSTDSVDVINFIEDAQINPIYYSGANFFAPDGAVAQEAYQVLHKAMEEAKKVALAKMVLRNRGHYLAIKPYNGVLVGYTMVYPDEIVDATEIEPRYEKAADQKNLEMAKILMENLTSDFQPETLRDEYSETLRGIIRAKAEGAEFTVSPREEVAHVVSLMDALKKSVEETAIATLPPKKGLVQAGRGKRAAGKKAKAST